MANINVRKKLDAVTTDLAIVVKHVVQYSGVAPHDVNYVRMSARLIRDFASRLEAEADKAKKG